MFIGIDPGQSGAISVIYPDGDPHIESCRLSNTERDIADWLCGFDLSNSRACIEIVHSMPKQGVSSSFKFGQSYGFLRGVITALQIPFFEVSPQRWQKAMNCLTKGDKNVSKAAAQRLWPRLKITHANADSLLIAEYLRTKWNSN
jgi:Holliday junction resolvasome RuvABC endonuclease subunit